MQPPLLNRVCPRCNQVTTPRRNLPPRYCANCGAALPPTAPSGGRPSLPPRPERTSTSAVWALVLGILSFTPVCGAVSGLLAIAIGVSAQRFIRSAAGTVGGLNLARAGAILGAAGVLLQLLTCSGFRI